MTERSTTEPQPGQLVLSGVPAPRRTLPESLLALRAADPGGLDRWAIAAEEKERLPLGLEELRLLAGSVEELELAPAEFERLIALTGLALGLDVRRKLTVGKTIYGRDREVDVLFRHAQSGNRLAVEAKYQRVKGTADEKLPYAVLNQQTLPLPSVIVYGGGGFHLGALHWLCASARATDVARLQEWLAVFFAL
jgi:hypothetical protein